ncbi:hypothetical protein SynM161_00761 [Synechococcus sp. M16.1]|nr:hypothetical protein SynM161_00761 [Synechococcus sp. M16.1]
MLYSLAAPTLETAFEASQQKQQLQRATTEPDSAKGLNCYRLHPWLRLS